ncbi:PAS domain-containing methyl-accepting chemotaxis protein [Vibrio caribbeanicus]|uniref:methyl-accepting chemotaxis protein n=1 Tax=Vibrio caribbeanicus TaxID=701175 RepID=UPI002283FF17|nr:PAS domain-containing methyl-accepting chemotaxis protein [Vibrio caribbeanicus]MCY9843177.1 PAS domain-containing methyl-accepting chemotaxis protein [Vibrio caribbeanicus]
MDSVKTPKDVNNIDELKSLMTALDSVQAIIEFDLDGNIITANQNFLDTTGYKLKEIQGKHHRIFCDKDYVKSKEYKDFWKNLSSGGTDRGVYRRLKKTGEDVWINASYNPVINADGVAYKVVKFATDITESKLRNAEYEGKIDAINRVQAVIEFTLDGTILNANENFLSTVGYTLDEIKGKHHRIFCDPDYASTKEYVDFWKQLGSGKPDAGEYKRFDKNGNEVWINASYNPVLDANGKPYKVIKYATNITESKRKNAEFEGKITAINRVQAVIEFNLDGTILNANENFLATVGYSLDEIKGKHHRIFCDPEYAATKEYADFWKKLGSGEPDSGEYQRFDKNGKEVWINASYNPVFDPNGKPYKVVKYATNITESKLRNSEFEGKIEAINRIQAVIEFELDGTIIKANDNFLATVGYTLDEIKGKHHRIFCDPEYTSTQEYTDFWKKLGSGEPDAGEYQRFDKDGNEVWINASYNPVFDPSGKPYKVVKYATNITESKLRNAEFEGKIAAINRVQAVIEFNLDGTIIKANDNFLNTVGYSMEEIKGQHHRIFCDAEYASSKEYIDFWKKLGSGLSDAGEYQRFDKNGNEVWINASYNPVFAPNGKPYKVVKYATNITESKLRNSEFEGKIAAINRVQAVIEFNLDGTIIKANDNFLATVGYSLEEIQGQHHRIFCDPEYAATKEYADFWKKLGLGEPDSGEYKRFGKNGEEIWINASYNPVFDPNGRPYKVVKYATNITESKLRNSDFEGKIESINRVQAVIEFNLDGTIITANENFLQTVGYSLAEIQGQHHRIFCETEYANSPQYRAFWEQLGRGESDQGRYKRIAKGGKEVWIQATYNPILDASGRVYKVVKFATDISAQVQLEEQVTKIAINFAGQAKDISEQSGTVSRGAQTLGATTEEMNASIEELSVSIDSIAQNTKDADRIAKDTQVEADHGSKAIARSIESMELINKSSEEISEIVKVISEIASQTNLLAFNAAIEAARAGEHGLGFSVVADEVRKLAERSSQATKEISALINESVKRVVQGGEISKDASKAFEKIVAGVSKTTQSISEISIAAQEQQSVAKDVSSAIQQVVDSTEKSAIASESIANSTAELYQGAENLEIEMKKFTS